MNHPTTILIVDDIAANRETLCELLVADDYRLIEARDGPTALLIAAGDPPDLILLDVMMPGMDGFEVCRRIRADPVLAEVPVIMVTALDDSASRLAGIKAGADDFVTKPFNGVELRARVHTITRLNRYRRLHEMQAALHESDRHFAVLFELGPVAIYSCDASGRIQSFNRRAAALWGREPKLGDPDDRFCGARKLYLGDGTSVSHEQCPMAEVLSGRVAMVEDTEVLIERADGSRSTVLVNIVPIRDKRGEITCAINCFHDITERKAAESALRESEQWLRAVFEQGAVGVVQTRAATGRFVRANQRFCDIVGYTCEEIMRLSFADITHKQDMEMNLENVARLRTGSVREFTQEKRYVRKDGSIVWVSVAVSAIGPTGELSNFFVGFIQDLTERKRAEEQMLRAQRLENLGMLAAGIAHDFNNALAPIIMAGPLLQGHLRGRVEPRRLGDAADSDFQDSRNREPSAAAQRLLGIVESCAERGAGLVRQLMSFARGTIGESELLDPRGAIREVGELAGTTFPKSIRVKIVLADEIWPIHVNATQFHQVLLNLCVNARDAMPDGGELTITAANRTLDIAEAAVIPDARSGDFLTVDVRDTGAGIAPDLMARIWEPFFSTKGEGKGTGLGLSTVRGIVHQHDGFVKVQTRVGRGSMFRIFLPAVTDGHGHKAASAPRQVSRGRNELILIVDDDESVRVLASHVLDGHGYRTVTACDGADAIAVFVPLAAEVKLLLVDLQMPILGGQGLAASLRRLRPGLPVICMSGAEKMDSNPPQNEERVPFIAKPFQMDTLLSIVRETLDATPVPT